MDSMADGQGRRLGEGRLRRERGVSYAACFILLVAGFTVAAPASQDVARWHVGMGVLFVGLALAVGILVREVWLIARGQVRNG